MVDHHNHHQNNQLQSTSQCYNNKGSNSIVFVDLNENNEDSNFHHNQPIQTISENSEKSNITKCLIKQNESNEINEDCNNDNNNSFDTDHDDDNCNIECTCQNETIDSTYDIKTENGQKSVQITTPTESEQILFDPKRSAADLFVDNQTNLNDSIDQQISLGLSKDSTLRLRSLDDISDCDNCTFSSIDSHINDDVDDGYHSNNIRSYVSNSQSSKSTTTTSSYCDCSSNEIQPITYRVCLNCHKPLSYFNDDSIADKECSNLLHGTSSIPLISIDNHLSTDRRVYQLASQRPTNNVAYRPIINENTIDAITLDLIGPSSDESLFQDSSTFLMMTNDEDDDMDRPQFCHKCNIWYGSLDPSYPITCHCPEMIKSNAMNMNDSGSIYSVHMRKDFR